MMIAALRGEFLIALVHESVETTQPLQVAVSQHGFPCRVYHSVSHLLDQVRIEPPHIVVLDVETCRNHFAEACTQLKGLSSEIKILALCPAEKLMMQRARGEALGVDGVIQTPQDRAFELLQALDQMAMQLYYQFENEQLSQQLQQLRTETAKTSLAIPTNVNDLIAEIRQFRQSLAQARDPQELTELLMSKISTALLNKPVLFFKFLPAYSSLLAAQAVGIPIEKIRGVGVNLTKEEPLQALAQLKKPEQMPQLRALMREAFGLSQFRAFAVESLGEVLGVIVIMSEVDIGQTALAAFWDSYLLHLENKLLLKRNYDLETHDPLTLLANGRTFARELARELDRSRRTHLPTALIILDIDDFSDYNSSHGPVNGNQVLKTIAKILRKTSRAHDCLVRIENDRFCLLLPHTDARGAAVKAERLRRMIEATTFHRSEPLAARITVSMGVSEYPSLCVDGESLVGSADEAMELVKKHGGNRVCVASVPAAFEPEFKVGSLPSRQGLPRDTDQELSPNGP